MERPTSHTINASDPHELAALMYQITSDGAGWINLSPEIPDGVPVPPTPGPMAIFSKRGPAIPLVTWIPRKVDAKGNTQAAQVGIQHGGSTKARALLAEKDVPLPDDWWVRSDHPKRGMVAEIPEGHDIAELAAWLLKAAVATALPPTTGQVLVAEHARGDRQPREYDNSTDDEQSDDETLN